MNTIKLPQSLNVSTQTSVSFVVLLLTALCIFFLHTSAFKQYIKQQVLTLVEFEPDGTVSDLNQVKAFLLNHQDVDESSIVFQTGDEAFAEMFPTSEIPSSNPFHDMLTFSLVDYTSETSQNINKELAELSGVKSVIHEEQDLSALTSNIKTLQRIGLMLSIFLSCWAVLFVIGSIRNSLQSQKSTIQTMQLVGARKSFIWQPLRKSTLSKLILSIGYANGILIALMILFIVLYPGLLNYISPAKTILSIVIIDIIVIFAVLITTFVELTRYLEQNFYDTNLV